MRNIQSVDDRLVSIGTAAIRSHRNYHTLIVEDRTHVEACLLEPVSNVILFSLLSLLFSFCTVIIVVCGSCVHFGLVLELDRKHLLSIRVEGNLLVRGDNRGVPLGLVKDLDDLSPLLLRTGVTTVLGIFRLEW